MALQREGKIDEAIPHFLAALAINPNDASSNLNLAEYDRQNGRLLACIERCQRIPAMTQLTIQKVQAYETMALAYRELGDPARARECEQAAQKIQSGR